MLSSDVLSPPVSPRITTILIYIALDSGREVYTERDENDKNISSKIRRRGRTRVHLGLDSVLHRM